MKISSFTDQMIIITNENVYCVSFFKRNFWFQDISIIYIIICEKAKCYVNSKKPDWHALLMTHYTKM